MAIHKDSIVDVDLTSGTIHRSFLNHSIGMNDSDGDFFGVRVFKSGAPVDLTNVSVQGHFNPPVGAPIFLNAGNYISGNVATVRLPQACYNYEGPFSLAIKLVTVNETVTVRIVDGMVDNTYVEGSVAPTGTVPTYQEVLAEYDQMVAATATANAAAQTAVNTANAAATTAVNTANAAAANCATIVAAPYSNSATYAVGTYCTKDGKLYECTTAITTAEEWTAGHWTETKVGPEVSDLKSAIDNTGLMPITQSPYLTQGYIDSNGKWANRTSGNPRCAIIPVSAGQAIKMKAGSTTTQIAALKTFTDPSDGTAADFSSDDGWTGVVQVATNNSFTGTVPSDAAYLYIWLGNWSALSRKPAYFIVNGYDSMKNAVENIRDKANVDSPAFTGTPTAVTPDTANKSTQLATTEFVKNTTFQVTHTVTIIEDGTNIDELLTAGTYRVISSESAATMTGDPPAKNIGYKLIVCPTIKNDNVYQLALMSSSVMPIIYRYYSGSAWTKWESVAGDFITFSNSKNLLPSKRKTAAVNNVNFIYNDGLLTMSGTATGSGGKSIPLTDYFTLEAGTYTLSLSYVDVKALGIFLRDTDGNDIVKVSNILVPQTITLSESKTCYLGINVSNGTQYSQKIKIQIEAGSQQTYFVNPSVQTTVDQYAREKVDGILSAFTNIECVGDSLTYGAVYVTDNSYRQSHKPYPVVLGHITGANVTSLATAGANATEWWNEYKNQISAKENALAIIFLGTNSGLTDSIDTDVIGNDPSLWANTRTGNYARIINAYQTAGYKVLLVKCFMTSGNLNTTNDVIRQFADRFECGIIENDYMNNISYHYIPDRTYANTLHYNDLGYAAFAHKIVENVSHMSEHYKAFIIPN